MNHDSSEGGAPPWGPAAPSVPAECHGCFPQSIFDEDWELCADLIEADEDGQHCAPRHPDRRNLKHWSTMHFFASGCGVLLTELFLTRVERSSLAAW